ncbi:multidrug efflux pump [Paenibacillus brasilensis]|uniref:Multidrug export protein MepA n=2 Tax=Paenibacillus brasilensis TaxID=128574 RepID=A0ABU0KSE2_9BACL|nr:multidrug efflux pump [Paenibacillus brasilensis]
MKKVVTRMDAENLNYFEKAPVTKAVAHFAVPMMLGTSISVIYSILNAYFLGTLGNTAMLTALALTLPLFAIIMALGNLIGMGSGTFISRLLGEKKYDDVKHVSSFAFYSSLVLGLIVMAVGLPLIDPIVHGLGATPDSFGFTKEYVTIMLMGSPFVVLFFTLENIVRSEGAAITSMIGMILSVVVNIILDALVIFVFHWGVIGVASATVLSNLVASIFFAFHMRYKSKSLTVSVKWFKATKDILSNVFKIGVPVFIMSIFLGAMSLIFNRFLIEYGNQAVAAYGISSRLLQFPEFILMGLCEGVVPLIAFSFTANKLRMKQTIGFTIKAIVALAIVFGVIVYLVSDHLIGLFTNDTQLIEMGSYILHVTFLSLFITGMTTLFTGIFQATAQGTAAFIMSVIQGITLIPVLFIANHMNGFHGVVWSLVIADTVAFLVGAIMLYVLRNKLQPELDSLVQ